MVVLCFRAVRHPVKVRFAAGFCRRIYWKRLLRCRQTCSTIRVSLLTSGFCQRISDKNARDMCSWSMRRVFITSCERPLAIRKTSYCRKIGTELLSCIRHLIEIRMMNTARYSQTKSLCIVSTRLCSLYSAVMPSRRNVFSRCWQGERWLNYMILRK